MFAWILCDSVWKWMETPSNVSNQFDIPIWSQNSMWRHYVQVFIRFKAVGWKHTFTRFIRISFFTELQIIRLTSGWKLSYWHGPSLSNQRCWAWTVRWCVKESSATLSLVLATLLPHSTILTSRIRKWWHAPLGLFRDDFSTSTWNVDQRWRKGKRTLQWIHRFPLFLENLQTLNAILFRHFHYPV